MTSIIAQKTDLDYELAISAFRNSSWTPEKRAEQTQEQYTQQVNNDYADLLKLAQNETQQNLLDDEIKKYKDNYLRRYSSYLSALSRTASAMITGPAKFPTERNRKRLETAQRRYEEFSDWRIKTMESIRKKLLDARTPEEKMNAAWAEIEAMLSRSLKNLDDIDFHGAPYARELFVSNLAGRLQRMAQNGEVIHVRMALEFIRTAQENRKKPYFTARHSVWKLVEVAQKADAEQFETQTILETDDFSIIADAEDDRVRIFFKYRPDEKLRARLKGSGWKWSPSVGAWQRKLTQNAIASAKEIMRLADDQ